MDEEVPETVAGEQPCQTSQHSTVGRLEHRTVDLASQDRHLVAQHDNLNGEIGVAVPGEPDQLEGAAERPA
ncbi:MAG: hypothetical protein ACRDNW_18535, partial [Trebonia sp.]